MASGHDISVILQQFNRFKCDCLNQGPKKLKIKSFSHLYFYSKSSPICVKIHNPKICAPWKVLSESLIFSDLHIQCHFWVDGTPKHKGKKYIFRKIHIVVDRAYQSVI